MQQICCVVPVGREGRFDALFQELDIIPTSYGIDKIKSLTNFVTREKTLHQQDFILFDLTQSEFSQEHILSAVQLLRRFSIAQLIFIASPGDDSKLFFGKLVRFNVTHMLFDTDTPQLINELRTCLQSVQRFAAQTEAVQAAMVTAAARTVSPVTIPPGLLIEVHVAGTMPRIGTTTQSFALYHYLKSLGFSPAVQFQDPDALHTLLTLYEDETDHEDSYVVIRGIHFCDAVVPEFNAYVLDMGVLTKPLAPQFSAADLSVLVGGTKPWELPSLASALKWLLEVPPQLQAVLLSFSANEDVEGIQQYISSPWTCASYHPEIWTPGSAAAYANVILPHIKKICGDGL